MLTNRYPHVFSPIQIGPVRLKNRLGLSLIHIYKGETVSGW